MHLNPSPKPITPENPHYQQIAETMQKLAALYLGEPAENVSVEVGRRGAVVCYPNGRGIRLMIAVAAPDDEIRV
jgi:hypothetical protein